MYYEGVPGNETIQAHKLLQFIKFINPRRRRGRGLQ